MKMVITLRSGVQIKMDVDEFSTGQSPVFGELRSLKWTGLAPGSNEVTWLNLSEVVAVHADRSSPVEVTDEAP